MIQTLEFSQADQLGRGKGTCATQMGWETRNGRGRYYTRSRRVDGRVVREYVGSSKAAGLIAQLDAHDRAQRKTELRAQRSRETSAEALNAKVAAFCELTELCVRAALVVAGYRRHHRGEWRKRRATGNNGR